MIRDKSLIVSSNGVPDTSCDVKNDNAPSKANAVVLGHKIKSVTISSIESNNDNISGRKASKTGKCSLLSSTKRHLIGRHKTQCNEQSNIKTNKKIVIPEIHITKVETVNTGDD